VSRVATALIDLAALQANLQTVRRRCPAARILAVIKANAYGHGMVRAAQALRQADAFGVASIDEALSLRAAGIRHPLVLLEGFFEAAELPLIARQQLSIVIHDQQQLRVLESCHLEAPLTVWLKIDSGMHRLGFPPDEVVAAYQRLRRCSQVEDIHLMSHLACADDRGSDQTSGQVRVFNAAVENLVGPHSLANSAGILYWPETHGQWVRPGIMLYGASPCSDRTGVEEGLQPVMSLQSALIAVRYCRRGEAIGYGGSWRCPEDMPLGIVAIGYGDGYPRSISAAAELLINGRRVPIVGRVSMDMLTVDLRAFPAARCGDPVVLWGADLPVEEVARWAGTIAYELLCAVSSRVRFSECRNEGG